MNTSRLAPPPPCPYRLRLHHEGLLALRCERPGPTLRFDPRGEVADGEIVVLTGAWPEQLQGVTAAFAAGRRPQVVASEALRGHLLAGGAPADCLHPAPCLLAGLQVELLPYQPIPWVGARDGAYKLRSALMRPDRALSRLRRRAPLPRWEPQVARVRLPDGAALVHLGLSLHATTPSAWLEDLAAKWLGAEWLLVGCDHGHDEALAARVERFGAQRILVVDLLGELRRSLGMPTALLTPLVDRLQTRGLEAYVFASKVSFRFE